MMRQCATGDGSSLVALLYAFQFFRQGSDLADNAFMCGFLALGREDYRTVERYLWLCEVNLG